MLRESLILVRIWLEEPLPQSERVLATAMVSLRVVFLLADGDNLLLLSEFHSVSLSGAFNEIFPGILGCATDGDDCGGKLVPTKLAHEPVNFAWGEFTFQFNADVIVDQNVDITSPLGPHLGLTTGVFPEIVGEILLEFLLTPIPFLRSPLFNQANDIGSAT